MTNIVLVSQAVFVLSLALTPLTRAADTPPNVVLIFADDLGYGDLGCYGATKLKTPNIDQLAAEGRRFTDAHSASAVCTPSRYGLLTGEYPLRAMGGKGTWGPLSTTSGLIIDTKTLTIGKVFKNKGYPTACLGKWHLGFKQGRNDWQVPLRPGPQDVGFDHYFGVPLVNSGSPYVYVEDDTIVGYDPADPLVYGGKPVSPTPTFPEEASRKSPNRFGGAFKAHQIYDDEKTGTLLTEKAVKWITEKKDKPFFLYFSTTNIHHPFTPAPRFKGTSQCGLYGDFIHELDWMVGEILGCLEENGLSDNTLVIFTSDNGGMLNRAGRDAMKAGHKLNGDLLGFKFGVWEGGHRVPFIARWPGKIKAGTESDQLICQVDLLATFMALTGQDIQTLQGKDSVNMLPALLDDPDKPLRAELLLAPRQPRNLAIRKGKWVYIGAQGSGGFTGSKPNQHAWGGPPAAEFAGSVNSDIANGWLKKDAPPAQLYDLENDPTQTRNVYRVYPDVVNKMKSLLATYTAQIKQPAKGPAARKRRQPNDRKPKSKQTAAHRRSISIESSNFVVIFTDDQGYADVGCFGSPDIRTPRLDTMAAEGIKFTSFYAQPICGPSRAALMTGCYPMRVAEQGNTKQIHPILHSDEITIAEILKAQGYATACFGKWDLAKHAQQGFFIDLFPTRQGFDYFFGTPTSNDRVANLYRNEELIEPKSDMATLTKRYTDEAIDFMEKHKEQPFFVYIPHTMPHTRLDASSQFKGKSKRGLYGDVVEEIDFNVGRVLDTIKELRLADNTYVIFTSDNGPWLIKNKDFADGCTTTDHGGSAGPLRSGKVSTFEGGVRVPFIVWGPGRVPAGKVCKSIASTLDVLPTFAALAGADVPSDRVIDGEDIRHLIHGEFDKANADKAYFYYLRLHLQAVRQGQWKLHLPRDKEPIGAVPFSRNGHIAPADRIGFAKPFLVNLDTDIGETTDVSKQHPDVVERLLALAESMREDLGDYDRVGKNMRFFDLTGPHPSKPPLPARKKPAKSKTSPKETRTNARKPTKRVTVTHSAVEGIGAEPGVMRRDPSDIIKVDDLYYVWYSKGKISPGYDATVWYATSKDGHKWTEQGMALAKGKPGTWEGASVFTPNILVAEGRYWLFYTGTSREFRRGFNPDSKIGIAVSDSPDGPWERLASNPALKNSDNPDDFDSHLVDDACLIVREGKYWLYYKGRQLGKSPAQTQMGLAIADHPQGPYIKHGANPVIPGNHEVLVWPQGTGVAAMIGKVGPKEITNSVLYSEDGIHFSKTHNVTSGPWAGGAYRPEAFTQSGNGELPQWGVEIGRSNGQKNGRLPFIHRFDVTEQK